jgi:tRNA 2-(methylsulfanyl)-N6-isopentenyladenosine37 hydroxylase
MLCLTTPTDPAWTRLATAELGEVLVDHAHCEMKAASNALALAARHPSRTSLVRALTTLAREELDHFQSVLALLERRGLPLGEPRVDAYAAELRRAAGTVLRQPKGRRRSDDGEVTERAAIRWALVDRLIVGAIIEARSCERFKLMIEAIDARVSAGETELDDVLALYKELFPAEARHYRTFLDLALVEAAGDSETVHARLAMLAAEEARIVRALEASGDNARATVHG